MAAQTRHYAFAAFLIVGAAWGWWYFEAQTSLERPIIEVMREVSTMTEWTHTLPSGGQIHVVVYRRDYETEQDYDAAVAAKLALYPPDPPSGG